MLNLTFLKPSEEELKPVVTYATEAVGEEAWRESFLVNIVQLLQKRPLQYRAFGAYWWLLKAELLALSIDVFGDETDAEWVEKINYGLSVTNIVAAFIYYEKRIELGLIFESNHLIELIDSDGDINTKPYVLHDPEMEILAVSRK
jgi:hypothetical protein